MTKILASLFLLATLPGASDASQPRQAAAGNAQVAAAQANAAAGQLDEDMAHLRMLQARLSEVMPALRAGDVVKARKSFFAAYDDNHDSIERFLKARSNATDQAIEKGMVDV